MALSFSTLYGWVVLPRSGALTWHTGVNGKSAGSEKRKTERLQTPRPVQPFRV